MFKIGGFYLTLKGQLVKIFTSFPFADGYQLNAAIYKPGSGWVAARYAQDGKCNLEPDKNNIVITETFEKYQNYLQFVIWFDRAVSLWKGKAVDTLGNTIVNLENIENQARAMQLITLGAEQKMLTWMREAGYDEEKKEVV